MDFTFFLAQNDAQDVFVLVNSREGFTGNFPT